MNSRPDGKSESSKEQFQTIKTPEILLRVNRLAELFPQDEPYILAAQIKPAADSVSLKINEDPTSRSNPGFSGFPGIALRSYIEVAGHKYLVQRRGYIMQAKFDMIYKMCEGIIVMISSLRNSLDKTDK